MSTNRAGTISKPPPSATSPACGILVYHGRHECVYRFNLQSPPFTPSRASLDPVSVGCHFDLFWTFWGAFFWLLQCQERFREPPHCSDCFECGQLDVVLLLSHDHWSDGVPSPRGIPGRQCAQALLRGRAGCCASLPTRSPPKVRCSNTYIRDAGGTATGISLSRVVSRKCRIRSHCVLLGD